MNKKCWAFSEGRCAGKISREHLFKDLVETWAQRSTCDRARVGVVISKNGRAIASGYNASPAGMKHCDDVGHLEIEGESGCQRTVHASCHSQLS